MAGMKLQSKAMLGLAILQVIAQYPFVANPGTTNLRDLGSIVFEKNGVCDMGTAAKFWSPKLKRKKYIKNLLIVIKVSK